MPGRKTLGGERGWCNGGGGGVRTGVLGLGAGAGCRGCAGTAAGGSTSVSETDRRLSSGAPAPRTGVCWCKSEGDGEASFRSETLCSDRSEGIRCSDVRASMPELEDLPSTKGPDRSSTRRDDSSPGAVIVVTPVVLLKKSSSVSPVRIGCGIMILDHAVEDAEEDNCIPAGAGAGAAASSDVEVSASTLGCGRGIAAAGGASSAPGIVAGGRLRWTLSGGGGGGDSCGGGEGRGEGVGCAEGGGIVGERGREDRGVGFREASKSSS